MAAFDGSFLLRTRLILEERRSTDAPTKAAIAAALADPNFVDSQAQALTVTAGAQAGAGGGLAAFLALLVQYLPQILAIIMSLFGPVPTPASA